MSAAPGRPKQAHTAGLHAHPRWRIASRCLAAVLGGYALTALFSASLALALPLATGISRASSVLVATLLSFVVYTAVAIWVFSTRSALKAWAGLAIAGLLLGGVWMGLAWTA